MARYSISARQRQSIFDRGYVNSYDLEILGFISKAKLIRAGFILSYDRDMYHKPNIKEPYWGFGMIRFKYRRKRPIKFKPLTLRVLCDSGSILRKPYF